MGHSERRQGAASIAEHATESESIDVIHAMLERETVEDGYFHSAENWIAMHIERFGATKLVEHALTGDGPSRSSDFIRLLGRLPGMQAELRRSIVERGLASRDVAVRDAALYCVEKWEDPTLIPLLQSHRDPVRWLAEYAQQIVHDLGD